MNDTTSIVFVAPFPPPYGGMGVRFERMVDILSSRGHRCQKVRLEWVEGRGATKTVRRLVKFLKCSGQVVRSEGRLVHCVVGSIPNAFAMTTVVLASRLTRRRVIISIGGGLWDSVHRSGSVASKTSLKHLLSLAHQVVPCNREIGEAVVGLGVDPRRVTVISNALPDELGDREHELVPAAFTEFRQSHSPLLLTVGGMETHYGLLDVVTALERLRESWPNAGLAAFVKKGASDEYASKVGRYLEGKNLTGTVAVFESVPWLVAAMAQSDVMVRATTITEGDSRAVREALAVGLRVVASDVGHRPANVRLYRPNDVEDLVRGLGESLDSPALTKGYVDPEGAENIRKYENIYQQLLRS